MLVKAILLKYNMFQIFHGIENVYGEVLFEKFISYIKKMYDLDLSYNLEDVIEIMGEDELILNIEVFFDSEDERHISEIGMKDTDLKKLILYLIEKFSLQEDYEIYPLENYENPKTTQKNINELQHILVQTCLDYMVEHGLTDIDEIQFSANGLSSSYEYKEWTPGTDSCLAVIGLQEDSENDKFIVRKIIGESI